MRAWGGVVVALALAGFALPTTATAAPAERGHEIQRPSREAIAFLGRSRGYEAAVFIPNGGRIAALYLSKVGDPPFSDTSSSVVYAVRIKPHGKGVVRARFGGVGRFFMRFVPDGRTEQARRQAGCEGRRSVTELGKFRGALDLEGEGGYFQFSSSSAKAVVARSFRLDCKRGKARGVRKVTSPRALAAPSFRIFYSSGGGAIAVLYAVAKTADRYIAIRASHQQGAPPGAEVQLGTLESRQGMAIGRSARVDDSPGTLLTTLPGEHPASATLTPPAPFHGQGDFLQSSSTSNSWSGSLSVSLPGLELPLTGSDFATSLCVISPLKSPAGCDLAKPMPLLPARLGLAQGWAP